MWGLRLRLQPYASGIGLSGRVVCIGYFDDVLSVSEQSHVEQIMGRVCRVDG